jgi:uncharacterized phage-like protein YoqJ
MSFNNRSDALLQLLEELTQEGNEYVLVGGYSGSEAKAHPFTGGMMPTIRNLSTSIATAGVG